MIRRFFVVCFCLGIFGGLLLPKADAVAPIKGWSVVAGFVDAQGNDWGGIEVEVVLTISFANCATNQYGAFATTNALGQITWNFPQPNGAIALVDVETRVAQRGYTTVTSGVYNGGPVAPANPFANATVLVNNCVVSKP